MENYLKWKLVGGPKKMKKDVLPHKFDCQLDRKRKFTPVPRSLAIKRERKRLIDEAIASTSSLMVNENNVIEEEPVIEAICTTSVKEILVVEEEKRYIGEQITPHCKSKQMQCNITKPVIYQNCSPIKQNTVGAGTSLIKEKSELVYSSSSPLDSTISQLDGTSNSQTIPSSDSTSNKSCANIESENDFLKKKIMKKRLENILNMIELNTMRYLGIPNECIFITDYLYKHTKLTTMSIYLTLKKIRISQPFSELGDDFGISERAASRIFFKSVALISRVMKDIIIWPSKESIIDTLPIQFKSRYTNVQSVLDCLEIEIQKPSDPIKQSLTWSEYKRCNTLKFLISSTPHGIINFISTGYGGRISDALIVEHCGFLEKLQSPTVIMADRGFKHIENLLMKKNCTLLRPPSVASRHKLSKKDGLETQQIASLRFHIERVIRRVREFKILTSHSCVNLKMIPYIYHIVIVVCGLINLQGQYIVNVNSSST